MVELGWSSSLLLGRDVGPQERFLVALLVCLAACAFLYAIAAVHRRRLTRIPIRIHVAGTRGKSSTVRLIAAGFRAGGYRVVGKVTGTDPHLVLPDGTERPIRRWGPAAIREQRHFIAAARKANAEVIVAEAMAFQPEYLRALEQFYIRATDVVITNVRPDHQEQLGASPGAVADAVAECVPTGGRLTVSAEAAVPAIMDRAAYRNTEIAVVNAFRENDPEDVNRLLALEVCRRFGIPPEDAEAAMRAAQRDIGHFSIGTRTIAGTTIEFANAFACNDTESLEYLWRRHQPADRTAAFLLNHRPDRPLRTLEFLKLLARLAPHAPLFIIGRNPLLRRRAIAGGFAPEHVHLMSPRITAARLNDLVGKLPDATILWGVGNFHGPGALVTPLLESA